MQRYSQFLTVDDVIRGSKLNFCQKTVIFHLWGPGFPGFWPILNFFLYDPKNLVNFENFDMRDVMRHHHTMIQPGRTFFEF